MVAARSRPSSAVFASACFLLWAGCGGPTAQCTEASDCPTGFTCRAGGCHQELETGGCMDEDGDGFRRGPDCPATEPIDCDDGDPSINPGEAELCGDGIDQNCVGGADEGCECSDVGVGTTRDCGRGICAGVQTCAETGWAECVPVVSPEPERCGPDGTGNGLDDDCNGVVDDGCIRCGERPDGTGEETVCFDDGGDPSYCSSNGTC